MSKLKQQTAPEPDGEISPWETAMIEVFVRAAALIGLPRSIGEIYGLLYCSARALNFDDIEKSLNISRGSVSQGLKTLRQFGAIKLHYLPGERKDHYLPELSMERLVRGFLKDQFVPHLESGTERLRLIENDIGRVEDAELRSHATARLNTLRTWQTRAQKLLPLALAVLSGGKSLRSEPESSSPATII
jgi:DNA-binding transcriptional regulator GbsR (MarR family)